MEPPSRLEFSNSSGGWLDCSASGSPQPTIDWLSVDGTSVGDLGGIRRVLRNGTLALLPFPAAAYRQDIHNTIYRCVASNSIGRIVSRDVQIRAGKSHQFCFPLFIMFHVIFYLFDMDSYAYRICYSYYEYYLSIMILTGIYFVFRLMYALMWPHGGLIFSSYTTYGLVEHYLLVVWMIFCQTMGHDTKSQIISSLFQYFMRMC